MGISSAAVSVGRYGRSRPEFVCIELEPDLIGRYGRSRPELDCVELEPDLIGLVPFRDEPHQTFATARRSPGDGVHVIF